MPSRRPIVCVVSVSGTATMSTRSTAGTDCTSTRNRGAAAGGTRVEQRARRRVCVEAPGSGVGKLGVGWVSVP